MLLYIFKHPWGGWRDPGWKLLRVDGARIIDTAPGAGGSEVQFPVSSGSISKARFRACGESPLLPRIPPVITEFRYASF